MLKDNRDELIIALLEDRISEWQCFQLKYLIQIDDEFAEEVAQIWALHCDLKSQHSKSEQFVNLTLASIKYLESSNRFTNEVLAKTTGVVEKPDRNRILPKLKRPRAWQIASLAASILVTLSSYVFIRFKEEAIPQRSVDKSVNVEELKPESLESYIKKNYAFEQIHYQQMMNSVSKKTKYVYNYQFKEARSIFKPGLSWKFGESIRFSKGKN